MKKETKTKEETKTELSGTSAGTRKADIDNIYINLLTDFGFKKLFCSDRNGAERLLALLRTYLPDKMEGVTSITFLPTELLGETELHKRVSFDIYGVTNDEKHVIVEMQRGQQTFFDDRIITYNCRVISQNVKRGDMEYNIPMTISFSIMDYLPTWFSGSDDFFHIVQLKDEKNKIFSEKTFFCFLELSKFAVSKTGQLKDMDFPDSRRKWAYVLKNMGQMEEQDIRQEDEIFRSMFEDGRYSKLTTMEKKEYKKSVLEYADVQDAIRCAKENSLKEGIEKGREEGREQGMQQGMQQGEANAKRLLARNMLAEGLGPDIVARISGLTEEEVLALVQK